MRRENRRSLIVGLCILLVIAIVGFGYTNRVDEQYEDQTAEQSSGEEQSQEKAPVAVQNTVTIKEGLVVPWEILSMPDGRLLVTERGGVVRVFHPDRPADEVKIQINGIAAIGEGGLLGAALHPNFEDNSLLYLYSSRHAGTAITIRVERFRL